MMMTCYWPDTWRFDPTTLSARLISAHRPSDLQSESFIPAFTSASPRSIAAVCSIGIPTKPHLSSNISRDSTSTSPKMMVDPFEVRMRFTAQLQHLNASVTSSQKAAHYALKYRDMDEDLHSCILEQLERVRVLKTCHSHYLKLTCNLISE